MNLGVFYKMADLKDNFREWLIQQGVKPGTITSYLSRLQKISHQNWDMLTINIIPLLVQYYELANKEYYLDRVTILQALEYFNTISDNIYKTTKSDIKLSLFDGQKDYFICDTDLKSLYDDVWLINRYLYESNDTLESKHNSNIDLAKLSILMLEIKENYHEDLKRIAVHIVYNNKGVQDRKTALTKYCNFLYATYKKADYNCKTNVTLSEVQNKNPNKTINGNFKQKYPITGKHARQVEPNLKVRRDTELGYVYTLRDLADIFNIDFYTAMDLMSRFGKEYGIKTVVRDYYSADATNKCLKAYHHYKDKETSAKYKSVNYNKKGYQQWVTREYIINELGIKKAAFYSRIKDYCLYIDYAKHAPKYYLPELEYLKQVSKSIRIYKKVKYNKNK